MIYGKIQTNRASLKKYLAIFTKHKTGEERCISPRSLPGQIQAFYVALFSFPEDSVNLRYFSKMKSFQEMSTESYEAECSGTKHFWEA